MPSTVDLIREVAANLELELSSQPFGVLNESEFQALLHARLLDAFPEEPKLRLADGVVERRPGQCEQAGNRALDEQPRREFSPAVSTARTGDVGLP
jgi:hypothetical protein